MLRIFGANLRQKVMGGGRCVNFEAEFLVFVDFR